MTIQEQKMSISFFDNAKETTPIADMNFYEYLTGIKKGKWHGIVEAYRCGKITDKSYLPAVTASGLFGKRAAIGLIRHSGIIAIDIDLKDNPNSMPFTELAKDVYTHAIHKSLSGAGLVIYVLVDASKHLEAFLGLEARYLSKYDVVIDKNCKDVSRLRFVSFDPCLFYNKKAVVFEEYLTDFRTTYVPTKRTYKLSEVVTDASKVEHIINEAHRTNTDLTHDYHDWVRIGLTLAKEFGENGRSYFHQLSELNSKYTPTECDRKFNSFLSGSRCVLGVLINIAKRAGIEPLKRT